jgi:hypothetical protein
VQAAEDEAKFWLDPIAVASNFGFRSRELTELERLVREHQTEFIEAWNEYFG